MKWLMVWQHEGMFILDIVRSTKTGINKKQFCS